MKAIILNCSLKASAKPSSTEALAKVVVDELSTHDVTSEIIRIADFTILPGVSSDEGEGDEWPGIRQKIVDAEILIVASPTWVGTLSSMAMRVLERMDAFLSEKDDAGRPVAYNHVVGVVAVGNEDGAKHVIGEIASALMELGFTVAGHAYTYYNNGVAMGDDYIDSQNEKGKERAHINAKTMAGNLAAVARALRANPIPKPD